MFAGFPGTMGLSDFPAPFIVGVRPWTSRHGLRRHPPQAKLGSPGSRARCFRTCPGSMTAQGPVAPRDIGAPGVAFRILLRRRHPKVIPFAARYPAPHVPLSTLHLRPRGRRRMTRGRPWVASPSTYDSFIHNNLAGFCRRTGGQDDTQRAARARGVSWGEPGESHAARAKKLTQTGRPHRGRARGAGVRVARERQVAPQCSQNPSKDTNDDENLI